MLATSRAQHARAASTQTPYKLRTLLYLSLLCVSLAHAQDPLVAKSSGTDGKNWLVVTTIDQPTDAMLRLCSLPGWNTVVVADTKTPKDWTCGSCVILAVEEQQCLSFGINITIATHLFSDSMRDHWVQRLLWDEGGTVALTKPITTEKANNAINYFNKFKTEWELDTDPSHTARFLDEWISTSKELETRIVELMEAIAARKFIGQADVDLAQQWI
ncbi:hypothetical protein MVEG_01999 [Podila verticillata NRRL 6337]|nr:hypothetical protein MVEG_01999 [Podila verticillata NRRL 6337]